MGYSSANFAFKLSTNYFYGKKAFRINNLGVDNRCPRKIYLALSR